jgi:hypothetical protein
MSYQRELYRKALRERVQRDTGGFRGPRPGTLAERRLYGFETELFREAEDITDTADIQDPVTGAWYFMLDVSVLDGPDALK